MLWLPKPLDAKYNCIHSYHTQHEVIKLFVCHEIEHPASTSIGLFIGINSLNPYVKVFCLNLIFLGLGENEVLAQSFACSIVAADHHSDKQVHHEETAKEYNHKEKETVDWLSVFLRH